MSKEANHTKVNLAIFISGSGTNGENLIRYFKESEQVDISVVISNRTEADGLARAERLGVPTEVVTKAQLNDAEIMLSLLRRYDVHFIVLAGFLPMVPDFLIKAYPQRIVNLHPALLPKYGGKGMWGHHVHEAVKAAGEKETGITVHYVSPVCDGGEIIAQFRVSLLPKDTVEDIAKKVHQLEMAHFPEVVRQVIVQQFFSS